MFWIVIIAFVLFVMEELRLVRLKRHVGFLSSLTQIDSVTGVLDRKAFVQQADREFRRSYRLRRPVTVAFLDVNDFGAVNAQHGAVIGDALLRVVAEAVSGAIRASDLVARVGGDEFAVIMPDTEDPSESVVAKLRDAVLTATRYKGCPLTLSVGVVTCHDRPASPDAVLAMAERLAYGDVLESGASAPHQGIRSGRALAHA